MPSVSSRIQFPETRQLSTAEVQNLMANSTRGEVVLTLWQYRTGFRRLIGEVRAYDNDDNTPPDYFFLAPAEKSTLALLAEKRIPYKTMMEGRDFNLSIRAGLWLLGQWAIHLLMPAYCFFLVVAGAGALLCRPDQHSFEPRPIAVGRKEARLDKAFAAFAACGMVALAVFLGLTTDWKVRRLAAGRLADIIAQHKDARFEVFEYKDGSRKLWISEGRTPEFIAPANESTLGFLAREGIPYQTYLADADWWCRPRGMLETSGARLYPPGAGQLGLNRSASALMILGLAAAAGSLSWWVVKGRLSRLDLFANASSR